MADKQTDNPQVPPYYEPPPVKHEIPFVGDPRRVLFSAIEGAPPTALYVAADDALYITAYSVSQTSTAQVRARILLPDGNLQNGEVDVVVSTTDGQPYTGVLRLAEGWLLSVTVGEAQTPQEFFSTGRYVQVLLGRQVGGSVLPTQVLITGPYSYTKVATWPGGEMQHPLEAPGFPYSNTGTVPLAGGLPNTGPTNGIHWRPTALQMKLTTSAAVANRTVGLTITVNGITCYTVYSPQVQAASSTWTYVFGAGVPLQSPGINVVELPIPIGMEWSPQTIAGALCYGIQAADQFTGISTMGNFYPAGYSIF